MVEHPTISRLKAERIIPVVRHRKNDVAYLAADLLLQNGVKILEITASIEDFDGLIVRLKRSNKALIVGAGTVLDRTQATAALDAGADFLVSPCWVEEVAELASERQCPYLPGAMTPGEVLHHHQAGAAMVKVFPADAAGGPGFIKALRAVYPAIDLMPTGGIQPQNAAAYLEAGATCVGIGGNLMPANALEAGDIEVAINQVRSALCLLPLSHSH